MTSSAHPLVAPPSVHPFLPLSTPSPAELPFLHHPGPVLLDLPGRLPASPPPAQLPSLLASQVSGRVWELPRAGREGSSGSLPTDLSGSVMGNGLTGGGGGMKIGECLSVSHGGVAPLHKLGGLNLPHSNPIHPWTCCEEGG